MSKRIQIVISREGKAKVEFFGYRGEACLTEAERLNEMVESFGVAVQNENTDMKEEEITDDPMQLNREYN